MKASRKRSGIGTSTAVQGTPTPVIQLDDEQRMRLIRKLVAAKPDENEDFGGHINFDRTPALFTIAAPVALTP